MKSAASMRPKRKAHETHDEFYSFTEVSRREAVKHQQENAEARLSVH